LFVLSHIGIRFCPLYVGFIPIDEYRVTTKILRIGIGFCSLYVSFIPCDEYRVVKKPFSHWDWFFPSMLALYPMMKTQ